MVDPGLDLEICLWVEAVVLAPVLLHEVGDDGVGLVGREAVSVDQERDVVHGIHLEGDRVCMSAIIETMTLHSVGWDWWEQRVQVRSMYCSKLYSLTQKQCPKF